MSEGGNVSQLDARAEALIGIVVTLWEDAEHDFARHGMILTLRQDIFPAIEFAPPVLDEQCQQRLPTGEELREALRRAVA